MDSDLWMSHPVCWQGNSLRRRREGGRDAEQEMRAENDQEPRDEVRVRGEGFIYVPLHLFVFLWGDFIFKKSDFNRKFVSFAKWVCVCVFASKLL